MAEFSLIEWPLTARTEGFDCQQGRGAVRRLDSRFAAQHSLDGKIMDSTRYARAWQLLVVVPAMLAGGCFWWSPAPNFHKDKLKEVVVIWDRLATNGVVEKVTWATTNSSQLAELRDALDTTSWRSSSVLIRGDPARIILLTHSGDHWEMGVFGSDRPKRLSLFNRIDPGRAGIIEKREAFLKALTSMIEADTGNVVDLNADFRSQLYSRKMERIIPDETRKLLSRFPEYR
jgi:hypothetical protein